MCKLTLIFLGLAVGVKLKHKPNKWPIFLGPEHHIPVTQFLGDSR